MQWSQMIPHTQKPGFKKNQVSSLLGSWVTPRSSPWPPTACTGCSCPSGPSGASENGPKWFPIPKNLGFKKKIRPLAWSEAELLRDELAHLLRVVDVNLSHLRGVSLGYNDTDNEMPNKKPIIFCQPSPHTMATLEETVIPWGGSEKCDQWFVRKKDDI